MTLTWSVNLLDAQVILFKLLLLLKHLSDTNSMKVYQFKYIDSIQFINSSLVSLTKNLDNDHPITTEYFKKQGYSSKQISLAYRKEIFPHEYIDSHDQFKKTDLPLIREFI